MSRGEVWQAVLDPVVGSEQAGTRPVVILQADALTLSLRTVLVVPFTSNLRSANKAYCVRVPAGEGGLTSDSVALCHQLRVCDKQRLQQCLGQLAASTVQRIERAARVALQL